MSVCSQALYDAVVEDINPLCDYSPVHARACEALRSSLLKKFQDKRSKESRQLALDGMFSRHTEARPEIAVSLLHAAGFAHQVLRDHIDPAELVDGMRPGPGATNSDLKSTCGYLKIAHSKLTCSSLEVYMEYRNLLLGYNCPWFNAEFRRWELYGCPEWRNYSRVTTVPKTSSIDRCIAVEPIVNSILQQGVKTLLETRLRRVGLDIASQAGHNRALARRGSIDGSLATVDFSNASDYITRELVKRLLPPDWYDYIFFVSTDKLRFGKEDVEGNICLSMGNAITFPLQTLVFLSLAYQCYAEANVPFIINTNVAVFGDDVILCSELYDRFIELARQVGLVPNMSKSFSTGEFRESCGADWLSGINIRGVYIKSLKGPCNLFVARNLLAAWYHRWGVESTLALDLIDRALIESGHFVQIPLDAPVNSGVRVFAPPTMTISDGCATWHYYWYQTAPVKRSAARFISKNGHFAIPSSIAGWLQSGLIQERPRRQKVVRKRGSTPRWGYINESDLWLYDYRRITTGDLIT